MKIDTLSMPDGIHAQWEKFIKTGKYDACEIRPQIVESWFRCHHAGVNPYDTSFHQSLNEEGLNKVLPRNFFRGASWREEEAGTNAIGTALITGRPM
jgi:sigma-54 dependent transcriptional regulator, acetoin dehydrogenase operon transcriptional activator AcoR